MIWRAYYVLLKLASPFASIGFFVFNLLTHTKRSRVLLVNSRQEILLVVNALGDHRWTLPGGGVKRREDVAQAAARELHEELHVSVDVARLSSLGKIRTSGYDACLFLCEVSDVQIKDLRRDKFELSASGWYATDALPADIQPIVHEALERLSGIDTI